MPRLLLVDDNPSIHKIAETLLATTPIALVCASSAAAALELVTKGEPFDVALVDISMVGMDGWTLVDRLREHPATARMPIAMMAGVLDTVDPERIKNAPIQGFLKKPVELRELGDRIQTLLNTPVPPPAPKAPVPSPFATMPAVPIPQLPEFRKPAEEPVKAPERISVGEDLLELTEEDLYPEAPVAEESLDLEELDIDGLRSMDLVPAAAQEAVPMPVPAADVIAASDPTPQAEDFPVEALDAISTYDHLPEIPMLPESAPTVPEEELPDLGASDEELLTISTLTSLPEMDELIAREATPQAVVPLVDLMDKVPEEASFTPPLPPLEESLDWSDDSDSMLKVADVHVPEADVMQAVGAGSDDELDLLDVAIPDMPALEVPEVPVAEALPVPAEPEDALALDLDLEPVLGLEEPAAVPNLEADVPVLEAPVAEAFVTEPPPAEPVIAAAPEPVEAQIVAPEAALTAPLTGEVSEEPLPEKAPEGARGGASQDLLDALLADPRLMDALAKAVVARLGEQTLREIAWEVMPELAERLPRN